MSILLCLEPRGSEQFPRFAIRNQDKFWDGEAWSDDEKAALYADPIEAAMQCQELLVQCYNHAKHTKNFVIPLEVTVHTDSELEPHEIRAWLQKAITVNCSYLKNGNGPTDDTLVLVNVGWGRFKEQTNDK